MERCAPNQELPDGVTMPLHLYEILPGGDPLPAWAAATTPRSGIHTDPIRRAIGWMVGAFIVTFLITRAVTRMIRAGKGPFRNIEFGGSGLHVHHQVFGIFLMLLAGAAEFAYQPTGVAQSALAGAFGAGAALTLDEFALWFHLDDVYWSAEGRQSVNAVLIAAACGLLLMLGANPFDAGSERSRPAVAVLALVNLAFALGAIFKGKVATGLIGVLIPVIAIVASLRIAKPTSPWAHRRYPEGSHKRAKSLRRFPPGRRTWWDRAKDLVGGAPST
ncbi:hypothetical protein LO772_19595 [Yinghuangia sp. ASG 101]|uniref:hypothetical protein n=1 Tax=Yinghuangia sp. ASG 101 TaxID=2896848 RepID=UPI001E396E83|nr:hypothetical protein [Yinghuangia sp. ASG 101]UGQ09162.1 hypothetical protein LO772_19595 [Yinghuangia sp. ASG 101]